MAITDFEERISDRLARLESAFDTLIAQDASGSTVFGAGRIPFGGATGILTDSADLVWSANQLAVVGEVSVTAPSNFSYRLARSGMTNRHIGINASDEFVVTRTGTSDDLRIDNAGLAIFAGNIRVNSLPPTYASYYSASLANNGILPLTATAFSWIFAHAGGFGAIYVLNGSIHTVNEIADPGAVYTPTAGNAGTRNIYWSAGNSRYEFENKTGSTIAVRIHALET